MWVIPIFVITAISGFAICAITVSSPGSLIPSSRTPTSSAFVISDTVIGTPTWLLLFPGVLYTW